MRIVRLGIVVPAYIVVPIWIAERVGYFAREGLEVQTHSFGATHSVTEALAAGTIDIAMGTPEGSITNALQGGPLRIISGFINRPPLTMIAQPKYSSLAELKGARLGTTSLKEGTRHLIEAMLKKVGLNYPQDYSFVFAGAHAQRWSALQAGTIDAAIQMTPFDYIAEAAGFANLGEVHQYVPDFAFCTINSSLDWMAANGPATVSFLRAVLSGMQETFGQHEVAAQTIIANLPSDLAYARRAVDSFAER